MLANRFYCIANYLCIVVFILLSDRIAYAGTNEKTYNLEMVIPPQCYTKTESQYNPCYVCHQSYHQSNRPNRMQDGGLQTEYAFSDAGLENHWRNLFNDNSQSISNIADSEIDRYINQENYTALTTNLEQINWQGYIPDLMNFQLADKAFDSQGFALDGSGWVAFNYIPLPGMFWPTNGSLDDVIIRLPKAFQVDNNGLYSKEIYLLNLSLVELMIKDLVKISIPNVDEKTFNRDINADGVISTTNILVKQSHYFGGASPIATHLMRYPSGTEFMHSLRYLPTTGKANNVPSRMKELRHMKKVRDYDLAQLKNAYDNERQEKIDEQLPKLIMAGSNQGIDNGFGWVLQGFIEDADGDLRPQSREELGFCKGCHGTIGSTIDQTFAFLRKPDGMNGWGYINLSQLKDTPSLNETKGELFTYLQRVGGNEFRQNQELIDRLMFEGKPREQLIKNNDLASLLMPSSIRAYQLNKAYKLLVENQSFIYGRDVSITPVENVHRRIDPLKVQTLNTDYYYQWDIRLNWSTDLPGNKSTNLNHRH